MLFQDSVLIYFCVNYFSYSMFSADNLITLCFCQLYAMNLLCIGNSIAAIDQKCLTSREASLSLKFLSLTSVLHSISNLHTGRDGTLLFLEAIFSLDTEKIVS